MNDNLAIVIPSLSFHGVSRLPPRLVWSLPESLYSEHSQEKWTQNRTYQRQLRRSLSRGNCRLVSCAYNPTIPPILRAPVCVILGPRCNSLIERASVQAGNNFRPFYGSSFQSISPWYLLLFDAGEVTPHFLLVSTLPNPAERDCQLLLRVLHPFYSCGFQEQTDAFQRLICSLPGE